MKKVCLVLSFLLLNSFLISSAAEDQPNPVFDIQGEELLEGDPYYMVPVLWAFGGGLALGSPINSTETCPHTVVQEPDFLGRFDPINFTPVNSQDGVIRVSTDLNIKFNATTICTESNVWKLEFVEDIQKFFVVTNGVAGNPGPRTLANWFKFEANEYGPIIAYKLVFCPSVCDFCRTICGDLSIFIDKDGTRRLGLGLASDDPFWFLIVKV